MSAFDLSLQMHVPEHRQLALGLLREVVAELESGESSRIRGFRFRSEIRDIADLFAPAKLPALLEMGVEVTVLS